MAGFDAEKKKNDLARTDSKTQMGYIHPYTAPKLQYSQCNNLMKKGRLSRRCRPFITFLLLKIQITSRLNNVHHF